MTNDQMDYSVQIPLYRRTGTKIKRLLAWIVDWNLAGLFVLILTFVVFLALVPDGEEPGALAGLLMMGVMMLYPVFFVLRDLVWGGRSLGKRIFGLVVLDLYTAKKPSAGLLVLRDLFFFISTIDAILLLVGGRSLGDYAAHTVVLSKKHADDFHGEPRFSSASYTKPAYTAAPETAWENAAEPTPVVAPAPAPIPVREMTAEQKKKKDKDVFRVIGLLLIVGGIAVIFFVAVIFGSLQGVKKTESYQAAYTYLVNSEEFTSLGVSAEEIKLFGFEINETFGGTGDASFTFRVNKKIFTVICHRENGEWYACEECWYFPEEHTSSDETEKIF